MNKYLDLHHKDLVADLSAKGSLDDDLKARMNKAIEAFKAEFQASRAVAP